MLVKVYFILALYCFQTRAMDESLLPRCREVFIQQVNFDIQDFLNMSELNRNWQLFFTDKFWQGVYLKSKGNSVKINEDLNYKINFKLHHIILIIHASSECFRPENALPLGGNERVRFSEIVCPNAADVRLFECIKKQKPQVCCTCLEQYNRNNNQLAENMQKLLDLALSEDVLFIFPASNDSIYLNSKVPEQDIHKIYPNIIWASLCKNERELEPNGTYEDSVDIVLYVETPQNTALVLGEFLGSLRALRPDLRAHEIRDLVKKSADRTEESKIKIPNGGFLNRGAAIKAVTEYLRPA